ncbi:MAG TPA: MFS transporter, partial [Candidatus Limnocylindrales bacterium]
MSSSVRATPGDATARPAVAGEPANARVVLGSLILVAAVANLNLSVANVALPSIGASFDSSQTMLDLIAVGYSLGLAASVLWFGALGDRYGRKRLIVLGMVLAVPASLVAGLAPTDTVLLAARVVGGLSAGLAYPTTLALITALWSGPARTRSIAMWSALGGGTAMLGPLLAGLLLERFVWGSLFLVTIPLALFALYVAWRHVPAHVGESTEPVDNIGGLLSAVMIGALVVGLNFIGVPTLQTLAAGLFIVAGIVLVLFLLRQRRVAAPLYDLRVAARPTFWVAGFAGIIVFGSLMGIAFINQQYLQNVLGYNTLQAGASILPAVVFMVLVAPRSARLVAERGSRATLLLGQSILGLAFIAMFALWHEGTPYYVVMIPLILMGIGVGLAGTPSSNSLTGSVPVRRAGMASGTADLQRDLGG